MTEPTKIEAKRMHVWTTPAQHEAILAAAKAQSATTGIRMTCSDYVRAAVMQALKRDGVRVAA